MFFTTSLLCLNLFLSKSSTISPKMATHWIIITVLSKAKAFEHICFFIGELHLNISTAMQALWQHLHVLNLLLGQFFTNLWPFQKLKCLSFDHYFLVVESQWWTISVQCSLSMEGKFLLHMLMQVQLFLRLCNQTWLAGPLGFKR